MSRRPQHPDGPVSSSLPSLFDLPPPPPPQESTSAIAGTAAAKLAPNRRDQILTILRAAGRQGMTLYEIAAALGVAVHTISGRLTELQRAQRIITTGDRRPSPFGNPCEVYCLAPSVFEPGGAE